MPTLRAYLEMLATAEGGPTPMTYTAVATKTGIYRRNLSVPLGEESRRSFEERGVLISALVVSAASELPGEGFFALAQELGRDCSNKFACWINELNLIRGAYPRN